MGDGYPATDGRKREAIHAIASSRANMTRFSWYLQRLKKMPAREYLYRFGQAFKKRADRHVAGCRGTNCAFSRFPDIPQPNISDCEEIFPNIKALVAHDAERTARHQFNFFGIEKDFGDPINWHLDPKTGKSWPLKFWGDINYRDGKTIGGIKFAWELNRLQHWPRLATAYRLTGNSKYLEEIFSELGHWMKANPYPKGINWISGIELGLRIVSLYYSLKLIGTKRLGAEEKTNILNFVQLHSRHLYRYPSKYSSCANHALAEALGLFIAGIVFPFLKAATKWKAFGKDVLEREVTRQILPDGTSFEYTIPYLQFIADHFLIYYLICKDFKEGIPAKIEQRLRAVCEFMVHIMDNKGNIPMIGDDDDGYLLKLSPGDNNNFLSLLNTCSILFKRPDWVHPAAQFDAKTLLLLGDSAIQQWEGLNGERAWKRKSAYFKDAGLGVIAHRKSGKEILFIGNNGPAGLEPLGGHGHADALSFWLSVDGQPFFVDPGTYLYHSGGKWRRYFRSTAAHNTVEIDGHDQAEQVADFMFGSFYGIQDVYWSEEADKTIWEAAHDGYRRLSDPVVHRREVTFHKQRHLFTIMDSITAKEKHEVKLFFHLHPDVSVHHEGDNAYLISSDTATILLTVDKTTKATIFRGSEDPLSGWYSPRFNRLQETTTLVFSKETRGNSVIESEVAIL